MRVTFSAPFDYSPAALNGRVTIAYEAGKTYSVTRECGEAAIAAGKASAAPRRRADASEGA